MEELRQELRSEPWLVKHLNEVVRAMGKNREIDRTSGVVSLTASPRLPGLNGGRDGIE